MEYTLENFGLTKSPLDAWRGAGSHSKRPPRTIEPLKPSELAKTVKVVSPVATRSKSPETIILYVEKPSNTGSFSKEG